MNLGTEDPGLKSAFQRAYLLGLALCVIWPLMLQLLLGRTIQPGANAPAGPFQQLGYTFTGLTFLAAAFVTWRSQKMRGAFRALAPAERPRVMFREIVVYAALFELSSLYGLLYWMMVGQDPQGAQFSRTFLVLSSVMFFVFVPRLGAWQAAADGESA